jgi:hypothetical protein
MLYAFIQNLQHWTIRVALHMCRLKISMHTYKIYVFKLHACVLKIFLFSMKASSCSCCSAAIQCWIARIKFAAWVWPARQRNRWILMHLNFFSMHVIWLSSTSMRILNFLWFIIFVFILLLDMTCNEIELLIFGHGGYVFSTLSEQISIYYCSTFLYIVGAAICALSHNSIHCWSTLLCIIRTLWHTLLEQLFVHFYTILYVVGIQFYTLLYAFLGLGPSRARYNNPQKRWYFGFYALFIY